MTGEGWDRAGRLLFATGWGFFVPYLLIAIGVAGFGGTVPAARALFQALHVLLGALFVLWAGRQLRRASPMGLLFWLCLAALFFLPGAYLEFPADPWDHYGRILRWAREQGSLTHAALVDEFAFAWNASFLSLVPLSARRLALDLLSAFWQLLLAWQFFRFFRRYGGPGWAGAQVIGTIALFGTNVFGFYRYYALSATPLAYVAYLQGLIAMSDLADRCIPGPCGRRAKGSIIRPLGVLAACVFLVYYDHLQEVMFLGISAGAILFARGWEHPAWRRVLGGAAVLIFGGSLLLGGWVVWTYASAPTPWGPTFEQMPHITAFGTLRVWNTDLPYLETLGLHGIAGLVAAVLLFRTRPRLAALTLAPPLMLVFPPCVFLFSAFYPVPSYGYITYRILFAFPASVVFIDALFRLWRTFGGRTQFRTEYARVAVVAVVVVIIGLFPGFPVRGRMWFQVHRPDPVLSLAGTEETVRKVVEFSGEGPSCVVGADNATEQVLATHVGIRIADPVRTERLRPRNLGRELATVDELEGYLRFREACGLLVAMPEQGVPHSTVAERSGHWGPGIVRRDLVPPDRFLRLLKQARRSGWREVGIPPFYRLYIPPWVSGDLPKENEQA